MNGGILEGMKIPPRPPPPGTTRNFVERRQSPLLKISTGICVNLESQRAATLNLSSARIATDRAQSQGLLDEMEAAAQSGLAGDFSASGVVRLVGETVASSPDLALEIQSQRLSPAKLKLVE